MTVPEAGGEAPKRIALVLAGGGARGAYEMGVLRTLLPWLAKRLAADPKWPEVTDADAWRPDIIVGTSVGALNASYLAATADAELEDALDDGCRVWQQITWDKALANLFSLSSAKAGIGGFFDFANVPGFHARRMLDPTRLKGTLRDGPLIEGRPGGIPFEKIHENVHVLKRLEAAAVVATFASTSLSQVFYDGRGKHPEDDDRRGVAYTNTKLEVEHVLASAAIPSVFPPVYVERPAEKQGWYYDGGTRLNTPIKPAIALGATHLIVLSLHSLCLGETPPVNPEPELMDGAKQLIQGLLIDPLVNDLHTLAEINGLVATQGGEIVVPENPPGRPNSRTYREIPYIVVAPGYRSIGEAAVEVFNEHYRNLKDRYDNVAMLGRRLDLDNDPSRGELFSYLFFDKHFGTKLVAVGDDDAAAWVRAAEPKKDFWETGPPSCD